MYTCVMKPVTVTIPDELDAEAAAEAERLGISKSELFRRGLHAVIERSAERVQAVSARGENLWLDLAGFGPDEVTANPGEVDDVVYPR